MSSDGLGSLTEVCRYVDVAVCYTMNLKAENAVDMISAIAASRSVTTAFKGPRADESQELLDLVIARGCDLCLAPAGTSIADDGLDLLMTEEFGLEEAEAWRDYIFERCSKVFEKYNEEKQKRAEAEQYAEAARSTMGRADSGVSVQMSYSGTWEEGSPYFRGLVVTLGGTLWICLVEKTRDRPGTSGDWKMMLKSADSVRERDREKHQAAS